MGIPGVAEAVVSEDGIAYLKVDLDILDREALRKISPVEGYHWFLKLREHDHGRKRNQ
jgi:hypothetical protein